MTTMKARDPVLDDPILARAKSAIEDAYGDRIERMVLYGSRARGDARPDSDYDIAVFLHGITNRVQEMYRLADIGTDILLDTGLHVHARPYRAGSYNDRTMLMHEIRRDAVDL